MATKKNSTVKSKVLATRKVEKRVLLPEMLKKPNLVNKTELTTAKPVIQNKSEFNRLVTGDFTEPFSKQTSRLFRIFLSSTFSDFKVERNELYRRVFPSIKQRCAQLGYEFQVVDMRWGVSDTADVDHTADLMCMNEIERCIDLSVGLNFIYLVGNRYGYMYVPLEIDQDEFEKIIDVGREEKVDNIDLVQKWFLLDQNCLPPKYVYVPITTHYKHFEEQSAEQQQEKKRWQTEEKALLKALREAVDRAYEKKRISHEQAGKYFESITEREIRRGTMASNTANVIGVVRDFLNPIVETPADAKFFDSAKNERISNAINRLKVYCGQVTPPTQYKRYLVPWKLGGLDISKEQSHKQYIDEFCQFLSTVILQMVENTCRTLANKTLSPFHEDLLHHALFYQEKNKFFFGREELFSNVHARIEANRRNVASPIAFLAESGCGKTSFMARLAQNLRVWYPTSAVFLRFLGTSAQSTTIELVIRSLCQQLKFVYGTDDDDADTNEDDQSLTFASLVRIFHERLRSLSRMRLKLLRKKSATPKPLFILLDAIDQFQDTSKYSFQFESWLLRYLPHDVHIFISFIPTIERVNLKDLFTQFIRNDESALFHIPRLRPVDFENIIRSSLEVNHRQLSSEQYKHLLMTVEHNPKPLYLKLLLDIARTWTYFADESLQITLSLPETIENAVEQLFARLENRHGKEFVQYSLAYLVYGLNGISENELEDCLSINDIVLNEIYAHHDPPIPNVVHVPSLLCQSLLYSIKEYLSRKRIHNKHILSFYHRKFLEATSNRYEHLRKQCHEHLIEIYCNDQTAYKRTITLKKRNNMVIQDADRLISSQTTNNLNQRKLVALPYHCLEFGSGKDNILRTVCLFNLNFLSCQLKSLGHTIFIDAIRQCLRLKPNWSDLRCLYHAIWSIDDNMIADTDVTLIISEQILGFIDDQQTSRLYKKSNELNTSQELEKLLIQCRQYCSEHDNCFRSLYASFPQETDALAWSFSSVTDVLYLNEFYCLVVIDGTYDTENKQVSTLIQTYTVAVINLQTGKVDRIDLDETFDKIWSGYITKNGNKVYLFGTNDLKVYNTRSGDMIDERLLSFDNKSFCNKAYCFTNNEEQLVLANEWRLIAMDQTEENTIYRSARIPVKHSSFEIKDTLNVSVSLRCVGANDDYVLCLIFDECNQALITLWALNEHVEILIMRFAFLNLEITSPDLFDFPINNNEIVYLATTDGYLRTFDLIKIKSNTKVQTLTTEDTLIPQVHILPNEELDRLVCLSDDLIAISTKKQVMLFDRKDLSTIVQQIPISESRYAWNMITQDEHRHVLITTDASQQFITIYRSDQTSKLNEMQVNFRANVQDLKLVQTTTMMDNDEKKKAYVLILLDDETIQLLDTNQLSQASLQPTGLFTKIRNYNTGKQFVAACEYDTSRPIVMRSTNKPSHTIESLYSLDKFQIESIALFDNDQYYIILTGEQVIYSYSVHNLNELLFEYDLKLKNQLKCFSVQTFHSNLIIFMFMNAFICLRMKYDNIETKFNIESEQIFPIRNRNVEYSMEFTPNKCFLILKQYVNPTNDEYLSDFRVFSCNEQAQLTAIKEPITYIKSKVSKTGQITSFMTYTSSITRSELWVAYQGSILHVRLPSILAELDVRSNFHSWMRHSLVLYNHTTEKYRLSISITCLAIQSPNDSCLASGADDGSIVIWYLTTNPRYDVLESIHNDQITGLIFDPNSKRLFSSSRDRTLAIWSPTTLLHVLHAHVPIDKINLFPSSNILLAQGRFWGFDRLLMFYIDNYFPSSTTIPKDSINKESTNTSNVAPSEVASWAL
ncbi:unnamed protein product [Adineta ricciae]|uniref:Uncharacterized protein n=1 Tax=Adineta ricciae TaxID=249248 RepID=A0A814I373_ADIRI|nr:unnamed protein product [Adineta ricciae]